MEQDFYKTLFSFLPSLCNTSTIPRTTRSRGTCSHNNKWTASCSNTCDSAFKEKMESSSLCIRFQTGECMELSSLLIQHQAHEAHLGNIDSLFFWCDQMFSLHFQLAHGNFLTGREWYWQATAGCANVFNSPAINLEMTSRIGLDS